MASSSSTRVWLPLVAVLVCVLLASSWSADTTVAEAAGAPAPSTSSASGSGCNPLTNKACSVLPNGGGIDLDGDGDADELPSFSPHFNILGHGN